MGLGADGLAQHPPHPRSLSPSTHPHYPARNFRHDTNSTNLLSPTFSPATLAEPSSGGFGRVKV